MSYPYIKETWKNHIVDPISNDVIEEGTRFTASRMNNIEDAIDHVCNTALLQNEADHLRLRMELEMLGRSPVNNGTFFDTLDGKAPKSMTRDTRISILQSAINVGTTSLLLDDVNFIVGEVVTMSDEKNLENVTITMINGNTITITPTTKAFKKGAFVTRSNAFVDTINKKNLFGNWGTYTVEVIR